MHPKQGTDAALAMAMGHVILKEFTSRRQSARSAYFDDYCPPLHRHADAGDALGALPGRRRCWCRILRAATSTAAPVRPTTLNGRRRRSTRNGKVVLPNGSIGFRWGPDGAPIRPVEPRKPKARRPRRQARLSVLEGEASARDRRRSASRISAASSASTSPTTQAATCWSRNVPVQRISLGKDGAARPWSPPCSTCRRATTASDRGRRASWREELRRRHARYTPAWQERSPARRARR